MRDFNFDDPILISICQAGQWRKAHSEVWLADNKIYLETDSAAWVKIDWTADFSADARVLGDAWERAYGDLYWKPIGMPAFHPWYFSVKEPECIHCIGVKTQPSAFCVWSVGKNTLSLLLDVRCGCRDTLFDGRKVELAELVSLKQQGDTFDVIHAFCRMMCDDPVLRREPIYGGDDWYAYYGNNSFDKVLRHAKMLAECAEGLQNRPYQVVDAGWQLCHNFYYGEEFIGGPYQYCNKNFGNMKDLADAMKAIDVHPGIWFRPLETAEYVPEKVYLRRVGSAKYLDPSHPEARERLIQDILTFREWGYEMIKHDFAVVDTFGRYGNLMTESVVEGDWTFYETHKTSAEITKDYYRMTADAAGDILINACNTFSHLSAGIFCGFRIGDDTSGLDYSRTVKMGVNTLAFRGAQHNAFYNADPDCVGITPNISWERNAEWLRLLSYSGMSMIVSVDQSCYTSEVRSALTEAFARASIPHETARPIDWMETLTPARWQTYAGVMEFNWDL